MPLATHGRTNKVLILFLAVLLAALSTSCGLAMSSEDRLDRAAEAIESGDFRAAIIDAKDVLRKQPDNVRGRLLLAKASVEVGDGAAAEKEFRRAIELGTAFEDVAIDFARALLQQRKFQEVFDQVPLEIATSDGDRSKLNQLYGRARLGLGKPAQARDFFNSALQLDPDNIDAKLGVATSFEMERNFVQARSVLDEIVTAHPDDVRGWIASGGLHLQLGSGESAAANFQVALDLAEGQADTPATIQSLAGLSNTLLMQGKNERARETVTRLLAMAPDSVAAILLDARIAYLDEDWTRAEQNLQRVLRVSPDNQLAKMMLGAVHLQSGNLAQAEMYLSSVVADAPESVEARRLLAQTRLLMQKMDEVQETLRPLITGPNTDAISLSMAATASAGAGDFDNAIGYLEKSLETAPGNTGLQFQLVTTYINAGRTEDADRILQKMNVGSGSDAEFRRDVLQVMTMLREDDMRAALQAAEAVTAKWPDSADAYHLLGTVQMRMSDTAAARVSFEKGATESSNSVASRRYLAALDEAEGKYDAARERHLSILKDQPDATWSMFSLARIAARENDAAEATRWLEELRATDNTAVAPRAILARLLISQRRFDDADNVVAEAMALDKSNAELHNLQGEIQLNQKEFRNAATSFQRATQLDVANAQYRLNLARSQIGMGDVSRAVQTLEASLDSTLEDLPSGVQLAAMKTQQGDLAGAMDVAHRLREIHPDSPVPLALEAEVHARSGDLLAASKAYDQALDLGLVKTHVLRSFLIRNELGLADAERPLLRYLEQRPLDSDVRMTLAEAYRSRGERRKSIEEYEKVIAAEPNNAIALNNLAFAYQGSDDTKAESLARRAYELMPDRGSVIDTLGWILVGKGSVDEGVELLQKAVDMGDSSAEVRYHLAAALSKTGKVDEARELLDDILSSDEPFASRLEAQELFQQL